MQATGKPDSKGGFDVPTAWASRSPSSNIEWLELEFKSGVAPKAIHVYESHSPGALTKITIFNDEKEQIAWQGKDPVESGKYHGIANIPFNGIKFKVEKLRLYIDTRKVMGWNEIDAVALIDRQGKEHWAVKAKASSTYASYFNDGNPFVTPNQTTISSTVESLTISTTDSLTRSWGPEQAAGAQTLPPQATTQPRGPLNLKTTAKSG